MCSEKDYLNCYSEAHRLHDLFSRLLADLQRWEKQYADDKEAIGSIKEFRDAEWRTFDDQILKPDSEAVQEDS